MNVVIVESPAKAKTINKYLGQGLRRLRLLRPCPRPHRQGRFGRSRPRFRHEMGDRRQVRQAPFRHRRRGERRRPGDPGDRPRPRGRGDLLAHPGNSQGQEAPQGQARRPRRVQRRHPGGGRWRRCATPARSTRLWSTPIAPGARSTISSASRSLRCCGANCRAPVRPAACNRSRCASSATASSRSRSSWRANIGRSSPTSRPRRTRRSPPVSSARTARRSAASTSEPPPRPSASATPSTRRSSRSPISKSKPVKRHPYPPFTTSTLQQEASRKLGLAPARTMQIAQRLYEGVDIGDGAVGLITYMRTDGVDLAPEAVTAARKVIAKDFGDPYVPDSPAQIHGQGQERPGSPRGDPPDRRHPPPQGRRAASRARTGQALRIDLDPHHRLPDGKRRARAHQRRHLSRGRGPQARLPRQRASHSFRWLSRALPGRARRRRGRGFGAPAADEAAREARQGKN